MPLEISVHPFAVTWSVDEHDPTVVKWSRNNRKRRTWHVYGTYDTPEQARQVATDLGRTQFIPKEK